MNTDDDFDYRRRFGGVARLYGDEAFARFEQAHVCVVGVGGVGSWAVEALARSAIGRLTLIDLDHIAPSNTNRQLHALDDNFGKAKVEAMRERVLAINPCAQVDVVDDFLTQENMDALMGRGYQVVIDAIDQLGVKVALAVHAKRHKLPLVISGGAGGRLDPARIKTADLVHSTGDPLLSKMRAELRRKHNFPRGDKRFGLSCIYSDEPLRRPTPTEACETVSGGLHCGGFGSAVSVTAVFGFQAAAQALAIIAK